MVIDYKGANIIYMLNKSRHTDSQLSWLANDAYLKALHIIATLAVAIFL